MLLLDMQSVLLLVIPLSSSVRDSYSPTSSSDYNRALQGVDNASMVLGGLMISGGAATVTAGAIVAATGIGAPEGAAIAIGGGALITSGEASVAGGVYLMANTANNKSQGYDRGKKDGGQNSSNKEVYVPKDPITGEPIKVEKSKAGNTKIDKEAKGKPHTQLRLDASGNYPQRVTFDSKGRKRVDTHFTTHNEPDKTNPHRHIYYKDGRRQKQEFIK